MMSAELTLGVKLPLAFCQSSHTWAAYRESNIYRTTEDLGASPAALWSPGLHVGALHKECVHISLTWGLCKEPNNVAVCIRGVWGVRALEYSNWKDTGQGLPAGATEPAQL